MIKPKTFDYVVFSNEATFELNGAVNYRYWTDENPH